MARTAWGKLLLSSLLLLVLLFGLIKIIINGGTYFLPLEVVGIVLLIALTFAGIVMYEKSMGQFLLLFVFILYLSNLVAIWALYGRLYVVLLVLALLGFLLHLLGTPRPPTKARSTVATIAREELHHEPQTEPHSVVFENPSDKGVFAAGETKTRKVTTSFSPGKYVASSRSNQYHEPKCDWAKKIQKGRQVWFSSKEEAWEKGYRSHSCIVEK